MYGTPFGNISGAVHLVARRPYILAVVATVALAVSTPTLLKTPPPPPAIVATLPAPPPIAKTAPEPCQVEVPEPTQPGVKPRQMGNCYFKYNAPGPKAAVAARVDNVCKHKLDDTILYLKSSNDSITLRGNSLTGRGNIGSIRAQNVRKYLVANGIAPSRITVEAGSKHSRVVELIVGN